MYIFCSNTRPRVPRNRMW